MLVETHEGRPGIALVRLTALTSFFWLLILFALTLTDYLTRG